MPVADTSIALPPQLFVGWSCRRCGHTGGHARCNIPVNGWNEAMMRRLFDELRIKLVQIHARESVRRGHPCIASVHDFDVVRGVPEENTIIGLV